MATLPAASDFTGASITEAQFKTAITDQRDFLAGLLGTSGTVASALSTLGALGNAWVSKTTAYTVAAGDRGKLIGCDGTFTLSLTAAATLGDGFSFAVLNYGTGAITIDPNSSELIDGASTITLEANESCVVMCTGGTAFRTIGRGTSDGQFQSMQVYSTAGSHTWTKPAGLKRVKVTVVGGGGGGSNSTSAYIIGHGGGGGGTSVKVIEASSLLSSESVTVGAGGAGATGSATVAGTIGGTSSFGSHCSATGGAGGPAGGSGTFTNEALASGGTGSTGDINIAGGCGLPPPINYDGGGFSIVRPGFGGGSTHGAGGKSLYAPSHGDPGRGYGGGGAGGISLNSADYNGGAGAPGIVIVEEFF